MFARSVSAALVFGAIALGTAGCSFASEVASRNLYSPSDGQQVDLESIKARNFMYLVAEDGRGYLIGSLVSISSEPQDVKIQYVDPQTGARSETNIYQIPAQGKFDFGYNGSPAVRLPIIEVPGQTALLYLLESDLVNSSIEVPVLDGSLSEYKMVLDQLQGNQ